MILQTKWRVEQGAKVLVYRAYEGRIDDKEEVTKLHKMIKLTLNPESNPKVAIPILEEARGRRDAPPFCMLVKGITEEEAKQLITKMSHITITCGPSLTPHKQRFLSMVDLMVFIIPFAPPTLPVHHHPQGVCVHQQINSQDRVQGQQNCWKNPL